MTEITFSFDEIPLCIGKDHAGNKLVIALISGECEVSSYGGDNFDIESVTLTSPIAGLPIVPVKWVCDDAGHQVERALWDWVADSIQRLRSSSICRLRTRTATTRTRVTRHGATMRWTADATIG